MITRRFSPKAKGLSVKACGHRSGKAWPAVVRLVPVTEHQRCWKWNWKRSGYVTGANVRLCDGRQGAALPLSSVCK